MFSKIIVVCVFALVAAFALVSETVAADGASSWFVQDMKNSEIMLQPGDMTYCKENFSVENPSKEMAEVGVILGNGANYSFDQITPGGKKAYTLSPVEENITGWTDKTYIGEARIVNSTGGVNSLKITCK